MTSSQDFLSNVHYLFRIAQGYKEGALAVVKDDKTSPSFETLAVLSLELFVKVLIGCRLSFKKKSSKEILEEFIKGAMGHKHDLRSLFESDPALCKALNIDVVSTFQNKFISVYEFLFSNGQKLRMRDFEALRYGTVSKKPNIAFGEPGIVKPIKVFLEKIEKYSFEQINLAYKKAKKQSNVQKL